MTLVRYIAIQLLAYGIDMGLFLIILKIGLTGPIFANVLAKLAAGFFAFIVHRNFTFRMVDRYAIRKQAFRYFALLALNVPVASIILAGLLIGFNMPSVIKFISDVICIPMSCQESTHLVFTGLPIAAKFIADIVCVALTYGLSKYFVFTGQQVQIKKNKKRSTEFGI